MAGQRVVSMGVTRRARRKTIPDTPPLLSPLNPMWYLWSVVVQVYLRPAVGVGDRLGGIAAVGAGVAPFNDTISVAVVDAVVQNVDVADVLASPSGGIHKFLLVVTWISTISIWSFPGQRNSLVRGNAGVQRTYRGWRRSKTSRTRRRARCRPA